MKELLFSMAKGLVDHPDEMEIYEEDKNGVVTLSLRVHPNDMGKVIGKQGRIANSMRQVLRLYLEAWRAGVKTIYYVRSKALEVEACESCSS